MRRSLAPFSGSDLSIHTRSWADFIITTFASRFSVHTRMLSSTAIAGSSRCCHSQISSILWRVLGCFARIPRGDVLFDFLP